MTTSEEYKEIVVKLHVGEFACYWCGRIFRKGNQGNCMRGWREHINIEQEPKIFCSKECKLKWIDAKQTFGELMP